MDWVGWLGCICGLGEVEGFKVLPEGSWELISGAISRVTIRGYNRGRHFGNPHLEG